MKKNSARKNRNNDWNGCRLTAPERQSTHKLQEAAVEQGMSNLLADGVKKARRGDVSMDEVLRVVTL